MYQIHCISNVYAVGVFTIYLIIIYVSFQNIMNTAKQKHIHLGEFFQIFKRCSSDDFYKYEMNMGFYNGKKLAAQL